MAFGMSFKEWLEMIAIVVVGIFAIITLIDRESNRRKLEIDKQEDRVITLLKEEVQTMKGEYDDLQQRFQDQELKFKELMTENTTLREIVQGRDASTLEYQKAGLASMKNGEIVLQEVQKSNKNMERIASLIERHMKQVDKAMMKQA